MGVSAGAGTRGHAPENDAAAEAQAKKEGVAPVWQKKRRGGAKNKKRESAKRQRR